MKRKIIGILVCTLLIATVIPATGNMTQIFSNNGGDKWMKTYGGNKLDLGSYAFETSDGGYIVVGTTSSFGSGEDDIWLLKTDYQGGLEWEQFYGGEYNDFGNDVQETSDGGYIITGYTESYGNGKKDVWLIKTDANGELLWDKTFGGLNFDSGSNVRETSDGGFIIIGSADHTGGPRGDIWLIKTDSSGNLLWDNKYGGIGHNHGFSIDLTTDGGYIIAGASFVSGETESYDFWIIKTDSNGDIVWDKKIHDNQADFASDVKQISDGGYIVVGDANYDYPYCNILLLKLDVNGEKEWDRVFKGYADDQRASSVRETNDGGFIIVGCTCFNNIFGISVLLIKTNDQGGTAWEKSNLEIGNEIVVSVEQTMDEGFIFTGYKTSNFNSDLWLIKTDSEGNVPRNRLITESFFLRLLQRFPNAFPLLRHLLS